MRSVIQTLSEEAAVPASALIKQIRDAEFRARTEASLSDWPGVTAQHVVDALSTLDDIMNSLCHTLAAIEGGEDLHLTLAIQYIELKTRWIGMNNRINYTTIRTGVPATEDVLLATVLSMFLVHIEGLVHAEDVERINEFLAEPIGRAA